MRRTAARGDCRRRRRRSRRSHAQSTTGGGASLLVEPTACAARIAATIGGACRAAWPRETGCRRPRRARARCACRSRAASARRRRWSRRRSRAQDHGRGLRVSVEAGASLLSKTIHNQSLPAINLGQTGGVLDMIVAMRASFVSCVMLVAVACVLSACGDDAMPEPTDAAIDFAVSCSPAACCGLSLSCTTPCDGTIPSCQFGTFEPYYCYCNTTVGTWQCSRHGITCDLALPPPNDLGPTD